MKTEPQQKDLVVEARELLAQPAPPCDCGFKDCNSKTELNGLRFTCENGQYTYEFHVDDPDVPRYGDMPELLRQLADEVERLRRQVKQMAEDARDDAEGAANEARWQERQGEDYGSY